ncbi:LysR family transcriptional regulator [Vibrio coralliilyticus]|uniref:LysR family transcriptional regulator n=1 Tax=Vibrio coralliilyticus TaxID=190893 RepID=A0AAP7DG76_9VIBR|nr:LysR family transcriptional regulator [Vibrio coralliilyticus]NOJ26081.1 LysR family transcriptional regulator [Vibrio coralliilyticus]
MKLENIQAFVTIAKVKSFTKAADLCFCTQGTMSQRLKVLEDHYRTCLIHRVGREIQLTEAGRRILPYCESILQTFGESKVALENLDEFTQADLAVCASFTPGTTLVPNTIGHIIKSYPLVNINSHIKYAGDVIHELSFEQNFDIGIISQPKSKVEKLKKLDIEYICEDKLVLITRKESKLLEEIKDRKSISLKEIQDQRILISNKNSTLVNVLNSEFPMNQIASITSLGNVVAIKKGVELGLGVSILSEFMVKDELDKGKLVSLDIEDFNEHRSIYAISKKNTLLSPLARKFIEVIERENSAR